MAVSQYRILVIDDDPLMHTIVTSVLGKDPTFSILCCTGGEEGIATAAAFAPDLILCDVSMPGLDGYEVRKRLHADEATSFIPFIFMTARSSADEVDAMLQLGAVAVITKPFKPRDLIATVRRELFMPEAGAGDIPPPAYDFVARMRTDAAYLSALRQQRHDTASLTALNDCAHRLAGAAGIYGFASVSTAAGDVERAIAGNNAGNGSVADIDSTLENLIKYIAVHLN